MPPFCFCKIHSKVSLRGLYSGDGNSDDKRRKVNHTTRRSASAGRDSQSVHTPLMKGRDVIQMQEL